MSNLTPLMYLTIQERRQRYLQKIHSRKTRQSDTFLELLSWFLIIMNVFFIIVNSCLIHYIRWLFIFFHNSKLLLDFILFVLRNSILNYQPIVWYACRQDICPLQHRFLFHREWRTRVFVRQSLALPSFHVYIYVSD